MVNAWRFCLTALGFACLVGMAMPKPAEPKIESESYLIPSRDAGIQLYVRNKHVAGMTRFSAERTVIFVHGTTQASESTFDLSLDGFSWMDFLAARGYDVYLVDLRGYEGSSRSQEMNQPAADNPPIVRTDTAIKDLGSAIDHVLAHRELHALSIIGWSWGATIAGSTANGYPRKQKGRVVSTGVVQAMVRRRACE